MKNSSNPIKMDITSIRKLFKDVSFDYNFNVSAGLNICWGLLKAKLCI